MKRIACALPLCLIWFVSCSTLSLMTADGRSWGSGIPETAIDLSLSKPSVDRQMNAASIEDEIERLAPLLFLQRGRQLKARGEKADYSIDIRAVEREYQDGWQARRSVSVELWVRRADGTAAFALRAAPLAAARTEANGNVSLASSRDLFSLLSRCVTLTCRELVKAENKR